MVRGGARRPADKAAKPRTSGIEKYGAEEMDEVLGLNAEIKYGGRGAWRGTGEREVLSLGQSMDEEAKPKKKKKKKQKFKGLEDEDEEEEAEAKTGLSAKAGSDEDDEEEGGRPLTQGWSRSDYYGGEDLGDDSDVSNDEDLIFEEARRLEELRAKRLKDGSDDFLATLIAPKDQEATAAEEEKLKTSEEAAKAAAKEAQFDSLFGIEAETDKVERDLSKLTTEQQRRLIKKEAPELMPLLADFQEKLKDFKKMAPLLRAPVLSRIAISGASYLKTKASLLLNTLTNLSFYLLLRAEGVQVRAHPVVSQLVWLRELHDQMQPLDKKLAPEVQKALKAVVQAGHLFSSTEAAQNAGAAKEAAHLATMNRRPVHKAQDDHIRSSKPAPEKMTLTERLDRLRSSTPAAPQQAKAKPVLQEVSTGDLLRLPTVKRKSKAKAAELDPEDAADPVLGGWNPAASVQEELGDVHKRLSDQVAKAKPASADANVAARPRRSIQTSKSAADVEDMPMGGKQQEEDDEDEHELIKEAKTAAAEKKAAKEARAAERLKAKAAAQFHPEEQPDGRRWATKQILENRGLVRQRKKTAGNARVANRQKYEKAQKKRRALVQDVREAASDGATYHGEETGLRTHVKKSLKLG